MEILNFCYWLQGALEVGEFTELNEKQTQIIKNHLEMTLKYNNDIKPPDMEVDCNGVPINHELQNKPFFPGRDHSGVKYNGDLQKIHDSIYQSKELTNEEKETIAKRIKDIEELEKDRSLIGTPFENDPFNDGLIRC